MINPKLKDDLTDQLCETVLLLRGVEECYQFFEDICTISELKALAQRLEVARMLNTGHTYDDIVARTGASTAGDHQPRQALPALRRGRIQGRFGTVAAKEGRK